MMFGERHSSKLSFHIGLTKMYQDLKRVFWWLGVKKNVAEYNQLHLVYQKAKIELQKPARIL